MVGELRSKCQCWNVDFCTFFISDTVRAFRICSQVCAPEKDFVERMLFLVLLWDGARSLEQNRELISVLDEENLVLLHFECCTKIAVFVSAEDAI